jgi:hypothetical protein
VERQRNPTYNQSTPRPFYDYQYIFEPSKYISELTGLTRLDQIHVGLRYRFTQPTAYLMRSLVLYIFDVGLRYRFTQPTAYLMRSLLYIFGVGLREALHPTYIYNLLAPIINWEI